MQVSDIHSHSQAEQDASHCYSSVCVAVTQTAVFISLFTPVI